MLTLWSILFELLLYYRLLKNQSQDLKKEGKIRAIGKSGTRAIIIVLAVTQAIIIVLAVTQAINIVLAVLEHVFKSTSFMFLLLLLLHLLLLFLFFFVYI